MKLYRVKCKKLKDWTIFALEDNDDPKEHIKKHGYYFDPDFRTLKELPFPEGRFEISDLNDMTYIFYNGECIVDWCDSSCSDYPEDLIWCRDISSLISQVERLKDLEYKEEISKLKSRIKELEVAYDGLNASKNVNSYRNDT